ncbi:hypothetical protein RUM44_007014 [Polyplax serrata]|uniref:RNA helicase n=1 Tax=Polyplax serrata TaxID=468196 RepID=A0ABR1B155_POLSC
MDNSSLLRGISIANITFIVVVTYLAIMDVALYFRIKDYPLRPEGNASGYPADCYEFSPLCYVTVKGVMLDHVNLYLISPFVRVFDSIFRISDFLLITPNMISFSHAMVAAVAGKFVSSHALSTRRIGVVLFELRTFLDGLDGHVARTRKHVRGEGSEVGSLGYVIDGVCDAFGITFLMIGVLMYLRNTLSRRDYLPVHTAHADKSEYSEAYRKKLLKKRVWQVISCVSAQQMLSSTAWNRYIALYQDLLEHPNVSKTVEMKEVIVFRSNYFLFVAFLWRLFNIHSYLHAVLLAIAVDKVWEFFKGIMFIGFVALLAIVCLSEMNVLLAEEFIYGNYLVEGGWTEKGLTIGITEPRRIAATTLAARVAEEMNCPLGSTVGYTIRFDDCTTPSETKVKYMTEGILIREMLSDPLLSHYSVIILDEVHERTLYTDIIMGLMKKILKKNTSLKLIVSSATVDADELQHFFNLNRTPDKTKDTSTILSVPGNMYSVDVFYVEEPVPCYVQGVVDTILKIHKHEFRGSILAFLTGQEEIERAVNALKDYEDTRGKDGLRLLVLPMHGSLPYSEQLKVFRPAEQSQRKVIISTNVAETSVTIPGVVYVVDSGFVKLRWFKYDTGVDSLIVVPISKASADQRAGRAGRDRRGKTYRLYRESDYEKFTEATPCEMQRTDLSQAVLQLKALGIHNVLRFDFPFPPPAKNLAAALQLLFALNAIDESGELTQPLGARMSELPIHPLYSKMLLASDEFGCTEEILTILSCLQVETIFIKPAGGAASIKARIAQRNFHVTEGDLLTYLNVYEAFERNGRRKDWCMKYFLNYKGLKRVSEIRSQMKRSLGKVELSSAEGNEVAVRKAIASGLFQNAAYLHYSGTYKSVRGDVDLHVHPNSVLYTLTQPSWVLFCEVVHTNKVYMRNLVAVEPDWLEQLAPHFYEKGVDRNY